jgi:DNA gyrase subunit B
LYVFIGNIYEYLETLSKHKRGGVHPDIVEILIKEGIRHKKFLQDKEKIKNINKMLSKKGYEVEDPVWNEERNVFELKVGMVDKVGLSKKKSGFQTINIGRGFIHSKLYQKCLVLNDRISKYNHPPFTVFNRDTGDESRVFNSIEDLYSYMMEEGKKGISIQRYKGLGEMNPDQLWETTMDPAKRNMLQVKIEDVAETDDIFTLLMGDEVEPRRNFINHNALEVKSLDI